MSITFAQVTQIESIRRKIEMLQNTLQAQANYSKFGYCTPNDNWATLPQYMAPAIKELVCKITVTEILGLLAEAEKEGVDITASKVALVDLLKELKKDVAPCVGTDLL